MDEPRRTRSFWLAALALISLLLASFIGRGFYEIFKPLTLKESVDLHIDKGMSLRQIAVRVKSKTQLSDPVYFIFLARVGGVNKQLQAGNYLVSPSTSAYDLLYKLRHGKTVLRAIGLLSGSRFAQIRTRLSECEDLEHKTVNWSNQRIMKALDSQYTSPEGLFYPETYLFSVGTPDLTLLKMAYQRMQGILKRQWQKRADNIPYKTAYEGLIAASLIRTETHQQGERAKISGVIVRRLRKGMPLQFDPTVRYAVKNFDQPVSISDTKVDSPYNTYRNKGLPPTPIALPTKADIHAALHPAKGTSLYFVARQDGTHVFTATYRAHLKAKKRLGQ